MTSIHQDHMFWKQRVNKEIQEHDRCLDERILKSSNSQSQYWDTTPKRKKVDLASLSNFFDRQIEQGTIKHMNPITVKQKFLPKNKQSYVFGGKSNLREILHSLKDDMREDPANGEVNGFEDERFFKTFSPTLNKEADAISVRSHQSRGSISNSKRQLVISQKGEQQQNGTQQLYQTMGSLQRQKSTIVSPSEIPIYYPLSKKRSSIFKTSQHRTMPQSPVREQVDVERPQTPEMKDVRVRSSHSITRNQHFAKYTELPTQQRTDVRRTLRFEGEQKAISQFNQKDQGDTRSRTSKADSFKNRVMATNNQNHMLKYKSSLRNEPQQDTVSIGSRFTTQSKLEQMERALETERQEKQMLLEEIARLRAERQLPH